jgi:hypothetical protein
MTARKAVRASTRERLRCAEADGRDQQHNIGHAAALLILLAQNSGEACHVDRIDRADMQGRWLRVEYLARQLEAHVGDLDKGLAEVEGVVSALGRAEP